MRRQLGADAGEPVPVEAPALSQLGRAVRAAQDEHGLTVRPDHVDMGRAVIVRIDHDPEAIEAQDGRHRGQDSKTQAVGKGVDVPIASQACQSMIASEGSAMPIVERLTIAMPVRARRAPSGAAVGALKALSDQIPQHPDDPNRVGVQRDNQDERVALHWRLSGRMAKLNGGDADAASLAFLFI